MPKTKEESIKHAGSVLEAIIQYACFHKLDAIVDATIMTCQDSDVALSNETHARYKVLRLKQKICSFQYKDGGEMVLELLESFKEFVSISPI
jgi:hypothetical protein